MSFRRSLHPPILLAIAMIGLLIVLTVGWVLLSVFGAMTQDKMAGFYWTLLSVGSTFIVLLVVGTVLYMILSIKAINLGRRQSNFIDSVTHELKSPIASMKLYLQTLSRHQVDREEQTRFFRFMLEDIERLDRLINQMLAAGRLDSERTDSQAETFELAELIGECAASVAMSYRVPRETIRLVCEPFSVRARRVDLDLIFRNLIDNAVKYAANPPEVEVSVTRAFNGQILATVSDNGPGIPRHLRRKLFGRFVRLGSELEREKPGTGLGLYIVREVAHRMGGKVSISDRAAGRGAVFEVQFPATLLAPPQADDAS